jgi:Protein of unknown function (DUF2933)
MDTHPSGKSKRTGWVLAGFLAIAGFFLLTEHKAHLLGILPFLLVAACPLLHLFHGGHGSHEHGRRKSVGGDTP